MSGKILNLKMFAVDKFNLLKCVLKITGFNRDYSVAYLKTRKNIKNKTININIR